MKYAQIAQVYQKLQLEKRYHHKQLQYYMHLFNAHTRLCRLKGVPLSPLALFYEELAHGHAALYLAAFDHVRVFQRVADTELFDDPATETFFAAYCTEKGQAPGKGL